MIYSYQIHVNSFRCMIKLFIGLLFLKSHNLKQNASNLVVCILTNNTQSFVLCNSLGNCNFDFECCSKRNLGINLLQYWKCSFLLPRTYTLSVPSICYIWENVILFICYHALLFTITLNFFLSAQQANLPYNNCTYTNPYSWLQVARQNRRLAFCRQLIG